MKYIDYLNILCEINENARDLYFQTGINLTQKDVESIMKKRGIYDRYQAEKLKEKRKKKLKRLI